MIRRIDLSRGVANPVGYRDMDVLHTRFPCKTEGEIPSWLAGDYLKQTGAAFEAQSDPDVALFDGLAGITAFHFTPEGKVLYSNEMLQSHDSLAFVQSQGRVRNWVSTMRTSPQSAGLWALVDKAKLWWSSPGNVYAQANPNVTVWRLCGGEVGAATEADGTILRFDQHDLKSMGPVPTMPPRSQREMVITTPAHYYEAEPYHVALEMNVQGYLPPTFAFTYAIFKGTTAPFTRVGEVPIAKFAYPKRSEQPVEARAAYMHCYAQTKRYLVLFLSTMRVDYAKLLAKDFSNGFFGLFDNTHHPLELLVLDKHHDLQVVGRFSDRKTACHVWHMSNAFEQGDGKQLVIDCTTTSDIHGAVESSLVRITVELEGGQVDFQPLGEGEFPQTNPLVNFHPYRFAYVLQNPATTSNSLVKLDVERKQAVAKAFAPNTGGAQVLLGEPVFVPRLRKYG